MQQSHVKSFQTVGTQIPPEAYLYIPKKQQRRVYISGKLVRYIFFGNTTFQKEEEDKLKQFKDYIRKNNLEIPNPKYYIDQRILLFLAGNNYNPEQTFKSILSNRTWRLETLPPRLTPKRKDILDRGYIYVCGRDHKFRPIIVLKQNLLEIQLIDEYITASICGFEYIINNMFLPGQIQNWIFIHDLDGMGAFDISIDALKKVNSIMSSGYGGKLYRLMIVNAPTLISMIWTPAKLFIDPVTVQKISLDGGVKNLNKLFQFCDKSQVQKKYGGTRENITEYWPPKMPPPVYRKEDLTSEKQYRKMYLEQRLKTNFISPNIDKM